MSTITIITITTIIVTTTLTSLFLFYLLQKNKKEMEELISKNSEKANQINNDELKEDTEDDKTTFGKKDPFDNFDFFSLFKVDIEETEKLTRRSRKEGWVFRGRLYPLNDCPKDSIFYKENKLISEEASHNTKFIKEVTKKENATVFAECVMAYSSDGGIRFVLEDVYGKVTTEPSKYSLDIYNEIKDRLVIFTGYIENGKFHVKTIKRTVFLAS